MLLKHSFLPVSLLAIFAMEDSDDEWARTLCRSAPSVPCADVSAPVADDSEDEWILSLRRSQAGVRLASQGEPDPSASSSSTRVSPVVGEPRVIASSSNPPENNCF